MREVLVVQQHAFTRANGAEILRDLLGQSVLVVDEPQHREQRRIMQPAFHGQRIVAYATAMVEETCRTCADWRDGELVDISAAMTRVALAIVGRALLGSDVRGRAEALDRALTPAMRVLSWVGPILEALPPWANTLRLRLPLPANERLARARTEMAGIIADVIAVRHANGAAGHDLLATLLQARDAAGMPLSAEMIADELATVMLAGHETTANALAWAWLALVRDPPLQERVHAEIVATLGGRAATAADVPRLALTSYVFAEALRLYPPASAFGRRALRACALGGFAIGAGDGILLSPYVSQRNPAIFFEPERFRPERWVNATLPPFAYFPFGGGARICIGEAFARMEGTLVLATILQRFAFRSTDSAPIGIAGHATLRPSRPIVIRAHNRGRHS